VSAVDPFICTMMVTNLLQTYFTLWQWPLSTL